MKCPIDTEIDLVMTDRQGIEIDYCPKCRGVWLDRGELDKLIERSMASMPAPAVRTDAVPAAPPVAPMPAQSPSAQPQPTEPRWDDRRRWDDDDDDDRYRYGKDSYKKKKRHSLLGEIFDF